MDRRLIGSLLLCGILLGASAAPLRADEVRVTLVDGSVLVGELQALPDGAYAVRSAALGQVTLKQSDIRRIEMDAASGPLPPAAAPAGNQQIQALQQRILADDTLVGSVLALQADPQVQAVLADPEIMDALRTGDIDALALNPKLRRLLDSPAVRELGERITPQP